MDGFAVLFGSFLLLLECHHIFGNHATSQCVQVGQANSNALKYDIKTALNPETRGGPYTIGAKKFDTKYFFLDFISKQARWDSSVNDCPFRVDYTAATPQDQNIRYADPCPTDDEVEIRTYAVKQNEVVIPGWLHFEIELTNKSDSILGIYVQVRDENFNAVGEFVEKEEEQCPQATTDVILAQQNEFQVLPCSAIGAREPKIAHALFMVDKSILINESAEIYLPKTKISRGIHFTWRMYEYWCNRHLRIRAEAIIFTEAVLKHGSKFFDPSFEELEENDPSQVPYDYARVMRKASPYWIHPGFFGAADIKLPNTNLTCDQQLVDNSNGKRRLEEDGTLVAPWILDITTKSTLENDYLHPNNTDTYEFFDSTNNKMENITSYRSCQFNTRDNASVLPTFAGRCLSYISKNASHEQLQYCEFNTSAPQYEDILRQYPKIQIQSEYINELTHNRTRQCSVQCRVPSSQEDLIAIKGFPDHSNETFGKKISIHHSGERQKTRIEKFFVGRKYHGVLCSFWTIFLIPVSLFVARYLKESFMRFDCLGIHFWYWIHLATTYTSLALFISSLTALSSNITTWGRSVHIAGVLHRIIGYFSSAIFFLLILIGGLRGLSTRHRKPTATLHSVMGFSVYIFNIVAVILSCFIPASPALLDCDEDGNAKGVSVVLGVTAVWTCLDVVVHGTMNFLQIHDDRKVDIKRGWYCPIFPILPHDALSDYVGTSIRKIVTMVYMGAAFIFSIILVGFIQGSPLSDRCQELMGELSCKKQYGCSDHAEAYAKRVSTESGVEEFTYQP